MTKWDCLSPPPTKILSKSFDIFWILEKADIPKGMEFREDRSKKGHYFLTVTEQMHVNKLVSNLKVIAQRMSVIRDAS
ncbi:hypothetical protein [Endozoicomonas numazuensis]|uniref:Uncharacterized protein n=1 Tax=Endozoicomonas numazuensis TaxID=1137799 RepID=A0A081NFH7_9GAMM|nr:hypothetical protein [Endozoicomonas numazuensis]KEQ17200.1 hypothetical protein GZ78_15280 [Endozoicomonas numazuensis]